jgi:hypothetical protein
MLKFLDKPITWKSYLLLGVAVHLVVFLTKIINTACEEAKGYDVELDYLEDELV